MDKHISRVVFRKFAGLALLSLLILGFGFSPNNSALNFAATMRAQAQVQNPAAIWEPTIQKFEEADKANPPKPGIIVFTGSSSFARWSTLVDDMKPLEVINRGFGGSQMSDLDYYAKPIVNVYRP